MPFRASAWIVRVEPYVHELATEMTDSVMTALMTEGSYSIEIINEVAHVRGGHHAPDGAVPVNSESAVVHPADRPNVVRRACADTT